MKNLTILFLIFCNQIFCADVAVVTLVSDDAYKERVHLGLEANEAYCEKHGYDFYLFEKVLDPTRKPSWSKFPYILQVLENPEYKWVVWLDADTIIMNSGLKLELFFDEAYHFIISRDHNCLNTGVMFFKNTPYTKRFIQAVYECETFLCEGWPEGETVKDFLKNEPYRSNSKVVPQRFFNSYCIERLRRREKSLTNLTNRYRKGDFLLHFAGASQGTLKELMEKYYRKRVDLPNQPSLDHFLGFYGIKMHPQHSANNEGYMSDEQKAKFRERLTLMPHIETIAEIGLNGGHSAENFFQSCRNWRE